MIPVEEALARVLAAITPTTRSKSVPVPRALGRIMARRLAARIPLPGFDNSAMDGYAVRAADAQSAGARLKISGVQPAGRDLGLEVPHGGAVRIFTGAPLPRGAEAVVMQEDTRPAGNGWIEITDPVQPGDFIRRAGSDLCRGQTLFQGGERLGSASLALLASQGLAEVEVAPHPRVAIVATGDELVDPGHELAPGQLYNSNAPMLAGLVRETLGESTPIETVHAPDELEGLTTLLRDLRDRSDAILLSGGVSVGDHDYVKEASQGAGFEGHLWKIRMKPGKPLFFASTPDCLAFGLPGNPVSSFVTFQIFARPALLHWSGANKASLTLPTSTAILSQDLENHGDRPHFLRMVLHPDTHQVLPSGPQQSHALFSLLHANCLLRLDANAKLNRGAEVTVQLI